VIKVVLPYFSYFCGKFLVMKRLVYCVLVLIASLLAGEYASAQVSGRNKDDVFVEVEQTAMFPGGHKALAKWLLRNMQYPDSAAARGIQGRVITRFIVQKDGTISDAEVVKSVDPLLDAEALRLVGTMPKWQAGKLKGCPVNSWFNLPIVFRLE